MASKKVVIKVTDKGLKETIADAKKLNKLLDEADKRSTKVGGSRGGPKDNSGAYKKNAGATREAAEATDNLTKKQGENYRHSQGVSNSSSNLTKNFSKQAQGLGGLIHVYATVAAHAFAVSAAFNLLKTAMDTSIVVKGLEELGASSGSNLHRMAEGFKEVTGHAISTAQAMRTVSFASSAGMSGKEINNLGKIARGAAIGLGRDLGDAVDRLTRGVAKLEPEILDELGIIVRVDKASKDYADTLGKTVVQLTIAEKRQAFLNAVQEQGLGKWAELSDKIDPNVYDRVAKAMEDLTHTSLEFINKVASPVLEFFSSSPKALMAVMVMMANFIAKKASHTWSDFSNVMREKVVTASNAAATSLQHMRDELVVLKNIKFDIKALGFEKGGDILKKYGQDLKMNSKVIGGIFNDPNINGEAFVLKLKSQGKHIKGALTTAYKALNAGKGTAKFLGAEVTRAELKQLELYITKLGITTKLTAKEMGASLAGAATVAGARWKVFTTGAIAGILALKSAVVGFAATAGAVFSKLLGPISWVMMAWALFEDQITGWLQNVGILDTGSKEIGQFIEILTEDVEHASQVVVKYNKAVADGLDNTSKWAASFEQASNLVRSFSTDYEKVGKSIREVDVTNAEDKAKASKLLGTLIQNYKDLNNVTLNTALDAAITPEALQALKDGSTDMKLITSTLDDMSPALDTAGAKLKTAADNFNNFGDSLSKLRKAFTEFAKEGLKTTPYDNLTDRMITLQIAQENLTDAPLAAQAAALQGRLAEYKDMFGVGSEDDIENIKEKSLAIQKMQTSLKAATDAQFAYKTGLGGINASLPDFEDKVKKAKDSLAFQLLLLKSYMRGTLTISNNPQVELATQALADAKEELKGYEAAQKRFIQGVAQSKMEVEELNTAIVKGEEDLKTAMHTASAAADKIRDDIVASYKAELAAQDAVLKFKFEEKQFAAIKNSTSAISGKYKAKKELLKLEIKSAQAEVALKKQLKATSEKKDGVDSVQYAQRSAAYDNEVESLRQLQAEQKELNSGAAKFLELHKHITKENLLVSKYNTALLDFQLKSAQLFAQNDKKHALALAQRKSQIDLQKLSIKQSEKISHLQRLITASVMKRAGLSGEAANAEKENQTNLESQLKYLRLEYAYEEKLLKLKNAQNELTATGAQDVFDRVKAFKEGIKGGDTLSDDLAAIGDASPIAKRIKELRTELNVQEVQAKVVEAQQEAMKLILDQEQERLDLIKQQAIESAKIPCVYAMPEPTQFTVTQIESNVTNDLMSTIKSLFNQPKDYSDQVKAMHPGSEWTQLGANNKALYLTEAEQETLIKNLVSQITPELAEFYKRRSGLMPDRATNIQGMHYGMYTNPETREQRGFEGAAADGQIWISKAANIMTLIQEQMEVFLKRNNIDFGGADFGATLVEAMKGANLPANWAELQAGAYSAQQGSIPEEVWQRINETAIENNTTWLAAFEELPLGLANALLKAGVVLDMSHKADAFNTGGLGMGKTASEGLDTNASTPGLLNFDMEAEAIGANGQTQTQTSEMNDWLIDENAARLDVMLMQVESYAEKAGMVQLKSMGKAISYGQQLLNWEATAADTKTARMDKWEKGLKKAGKSDLITKKTRATQESKIDSDLMQDKLSGYASFIGATGAMMKKGSKAQQAFAAIEKAIHIAKMAMMVGEIAMGIKAAIADTVATGIKKTNAAAEITLNAAKAGADTMAKDPNPYTKIATGLAVMAAALGLIGMISGGGGATSTPATRTTRVGSSATLETPTEQADSLKTALENIEEVEIKAFEQGWDVLYALRSIDDSMTKLSTDIIKGMQALGGIGTFSIGDMETVFGDWFGTAVKPAFLGLFGGKSTTTELMGAGIQIVAQKLADVVDLDAGKWANLELKVWEKVKTTTTKSGFFGFGGGTSSSTQTKWKDFDTAAEQSFAKTLYDIGAAVLSLGEDLGYAKSTLIDNMKDFEIAVQDIDLKDLSPEEQATAIQSALSAIANDMTLNMIPMVEKWRHAGEEYLEALSRVYRDMLGFSKAFSSVGLDVSGFVSFKDQLTSKTVEWTTTTRTDELTDEYKKLTGAFGVLGGVGGLIATMLSTVTDGLAEQAGVKKFKMKVEQHSKVIETWQTAQEQMLDWQQKVLSSKKGGFMDIKGFQEAFSNFSKALYSEGELAKFALANAKNRVHTGLAELGLSLGTSVEDFRSFYESKLGTDYFQDPDKLAIMVRLGEAFGEMTNSAADLEDAFGGIIDLIDEMKYGELSSLTQSQKYAYFKSEAEQLSSDAMAGDVKAGEKLADTMSKFVELSKDMFGGVGSFMNDRDWALKQLEDFKAKMGFAMGGVVAGGFRAFANGGTVSKPTLGLVGEGQYNEAIVPLPDGRSIPVMQTGSNPIVVELSKFREEQAELMRSAVTINTQEGEELRETLEDLKAEVIELRSSTEGFGNSVERVATNIEYGRA